MTAWWEWLIAAAFAPVAVWVLWRAQALSVEVLRRSMVRLTRHTKWLYFLVSWFGTLLHELSHASLLLISGHGIKDFSVRSEQGHVTPRRTLRNPVATLFFLAAAMAPLYVVPGIVLAATILLVDRELISWQSAGLGLAPALEVLRGLVVSLPLELVRAFATLDLARSGPLVVFLLVLLGAPGTRPSFVKGKGISGKDEGDIAVVRRRIRRQPWPLLLMLGVLFGAYFALVPWRPAAYWWPFSAVWAVALTGIVIALFGALWWLVADFNSRVTPLLAWLPPALFVAVQVAGRTPLGWDVGFINLAALASWAVSAVLLRFVAPRRGPHGPF